MSAIPDSLNKTMQQWNANIEMRRFCHHRRDAAAQRRCRVLAGIQSRQRHCVAETKISAGRPGVALRAMLGR